MASDNIDIDLEEEFGEEDDFQAIQAQVREQIEAASVDALQAVGDVVRDNVIDITPRNLGDLQSAIVHDVVQGADGDDYTVVYQDTNKVPAVIGKVMEAGGQWNKLPPHKPIKDWVLTKVGLPEKEAERMAWALQHRILRYGIPIPLTQDGRGAMFSRTVEKMESTSFHFWVFTAELRRRLDSMPPIAG